MSNADDLGGRSVQKFMDAWYKHPLSIAIVTILINLTFAFISLNNKLLPGDGIKLVKYTYIFSGSILGAILLILLVRKEVLYNVFELLTHDMNHRIHALQESLREIPVGIGDRDEVLERLCPKTAKSPIDDRLRRDVQVFEALTHIFEDCGMKIPIDKVTNLSLARYHYKDGKYSEALRKIERARLQDTIIRRSIAPLVLPSKREQPLPGELDFCQGLIQKKLQMPSDPLFESAVKAGYTTARCMICKKSEDFISKGTFDKVEVQAFIRTVKACSKTNIDWCMNRLSSAYFSKAKLSLDAVEQSQNARIAMQINEISISFNSWMAYFNKACNLSFMAKNSIPIHEKTDFTDESLTEIKGMIFLCLDKAFQQRPALARFSMEDKDLVWVKENCPVEYHQVIGKTYTQHFNIL